MAARYNHHTIPMEKVIQAQTKSCLTKSRNQDEDPCPNLPESTIGTAFIIVGLPISASLGIVSTVSTCVSACLLLTSKKYKKKLLKCYELLDKITSSLATFEVLISLSLDDGTVIDAKEFHKLQTLYLQLMTHVRNMCRKMKLQTEENFQRTIMDEISIL